MKPYCFSFFILLGLTCLWSEPRTFEGSVVAIEDGEMTIEFEDDWAPVPGDPVTVKANIAGRLLEAGKAEVLSVAKGVVTAQIQSGNPNIRMQAIIESSNPKPTNVDPDELYEMGYKLFVENLEKGDPFDWDSWGSIVEAGRVAYPYLLPAAESGNDKAMFLVARIQYSGPRELVDGKSAMAWMKKAADAGNLDAMLVYGESLRTGKDGVESNKEAGEDYLVRAAEAGNAEAQYAAYGLLRRSDPRRAEFLKAAAEAGIRQAQDTLADKYALFPDELGLAPGSYLDEAIYWYEKAVENGWSYAHMTLGDIYAKVMSFRIRSPVDFRRLNEEAKKVSRANAGFPRDLKKAIYWYEKSTRTNPAAYGRLGWVYSLPGTTVTDTSKALECFIKGAEKKEPYCMTMLARAYRTGWLVPKNPEKAFFWAEKVVGKSLGFFLNENVELGLCHLHGVGTPVNYAKAMALFEEAQESRSGWAYVHAASMYENGWGVPQSERAAVSLYKKATQLYSSIYFGAEMDESRSVAHERIAQIYVKEYPREALNHAQVAISFNDQNAAAYRLQALALLHKDWGKDAKKRGFHTQAFNLLTQGARMGDAQSHYFLGQLYREGIGTKRDRKLSRYHYQQAANAGISAARKHL